MDWIKDCLENNLIGKKIYVTGVTGHGIGAPIEEETILCLQKNGSKPTYRPEELWNTYIASHPDVEAHKRTEALNEVARNLLVIRPDQINSKKTDGVIVKVEPSQTATADFVTFPDNTNYKLSKKLIIGDVKSLPFGKKGDSSNNLISYRKIGTMCAIMKRTGLYHYVDIRYIGVEWHQISKNSIEVVSVIIRDLFKENPTRLRVNTACSQLQTSINCWTQDYRKSREEWCDDFISHLEKSLTR